MKEKREFIKNKIKYLDNCVTWLNWYANGEVSDKLLEKIIESIEKHCQEIRKVIKEEKIIPKGQSK